MADELTRAALAALPEQTVIRCTTGKERPAAVKSTGQWYVTGLLQPFTSAHLALTGPWAVVDVDGLRAEADTNYGLRVRYRQDRDDARAERDAAVRDLAALRAALDSGEASDGYHTHRELYDYRMLYNAHAAHGWLAAGIPVVKSRSHSDGEPCFGGGWFIVTAMLPTGQVSNHYRDEHWDLFSVPEVDLPPEYDGHTPADAADRLRALLADPTPEVPR